MKKYLKKKEKCGLCQRRHLRVFTKAYMKNESDKQPKETPPVDTDALLERKGYDALWLWFDLSRASWLTIPRVLLHEMPDEWQGKMAALLEEYESTFHNWPEGIGTRVQLTDSGKLTASHNWLLDYRHPAQGKIETLRSNAELSHRSEPVRASENKNNAQSAHSDCEQ
jgi:hypothetical protein